MAGVGPNSAPWRQRPPGVGPCSGLIRGSARIRCWRRYFYLSFWFANHYVENKEFFFPETYSDYYVSVAETVVRILQGVAARLEVPVLLIKLTNTTPYRGLEKLGNEVTPIFEAAEANVSLLHFYDIDNAPEKWPHSAACATTTPSMPTLEPGDI